MTCQRIYDQILEQGSLKRIFVLNNVTCYRNIGTSIKHTYLHARHSIWDFGDFEQAWHAIWSRHFEAAVVPLPDGMPEIPRIPNGVFHM